MIMDLNKQIFQMKKKHNEQKLKDLFPKGHNYNECCDIQGEKESDDKELNDDKKLEVMHQTCHHERMMKGK